MDELLGCLAPNVLDFKSHVYVHEGAAMLRHLFSVASGLDSMVLGETEITGQIKNAYTTAKEARLTGPVLNRVFQTTLQTAKEVRTHTNIGRGATSVGSAAVELVFMRGRLRRRLQKLKMKFSFTVNEVGPWSVGWLTQDSSAMFLWKW